MALFVIRHGQSEWNELNKFTGLTDIGLTSNGRTEASDAGRILQNYNIDAIYSSNLIRTIETAHIIADWQSIPKRIQPIPDFRERDYGDLTGKNKTDLAEKYGEEQVNIWRRSYLVAPPNGENLKQVHERVGVAYDEHVKPLVDAGKNVLIVAHGNSVRALFVHLGIKDETSIESFEIGTGCPIKIDVNKRDYCYENNYYLTGYQILDSRGNPTIEVKCVDRFTGKTIGKGSSPSGASCGSTEVCEMRDGNNDLFHGKSVFQTLKHLETINKHIVLSKKTIVDLIKCDQQIDVLDGTEMKTRFGGNLTTAISFCLADAGAKMRGMEMYEYIASQYKLITAPVNAKTLPTPFVNVINGGKHGVTEDLKIQEFMIFANENMSTSDQIRMYSEVYHTLKKLLEDRYGSQAKNIGDEAGFMPPVYSAKDAISVIEDAITASNYIVGDDVFIALDCAASEFYNEETKMYEIEKDKFVSCSELVDYYIDLIEQYPALKSIEDGFHESDYDGWKEFYNRLPEGFMSVGDDLFTTNPRLIKQGLDDNWANSLLLKVNQIGNITNALKGAKMLFDQDKNVIVSHRSGETMESHLIDIAVGCGAKFVKIGSPARERVIKFNRLLEIEHSLL